MGSEWDPILGSWMRQWTLCLRKSGNIIFNFSRFLCKLIFWNAYEFISCVFASSRKPSKFRRRWRRERRFVILSNYATTVDNLWVDRLGTRFRLGFVAKKDKSAHWQELNNYCPVQKNFTDNCRSFLTQCNIEAENLWHFILFSPPPRHPHGIVLQTWGELYCDVCFTTASS
jgi:hypothetical protein